MSLWTPPPRSAEALAMYDAAEADRRARPERYTLDPDAIVAAVMARQSPSGGDGDDGEDNGDWREGLRRYLDAARTEGRLNALGIRNVAASASARLGARFAIARTLARNPAVAARTVDRPVFVIGGWRTGTTLLQRLLDAVPALRGAYPSELSAPWRFFGIDAAARDKLIDAGEDAHRRLHALNPAMSIIHPSGGRLAEECVLAMGTDFRNWGFTSTLRCPGYAAWLLGQDFAGSYARYGDILRLLQDESGRRWILKAPAHTCELASLLAVFPDACVLYLHRDPVQTVTSGASLFAVFRATYSDDVDPVEVGRYQLDMTATWSARATAARAARPGATVIDIAFSDLVADPLATVRRLCSACDVAWSPETEDALAARLASLNGQPRAHACTPAEFGLDPEEIRARLAAR